MTPQKAPVAYTCHNPICTLGSRSDPGRFTGGISPQQVSMLTGQPVDTVEEHGEGYCPNCGELGTLEEAS